MNNNNNNNNNPGSPGDYNFDINPNPTQPPVSIEEIVPVELKEKFDEKQKKLDELLLQIGELLSCRGRRFENDAVLTLLDLKFAEKVLNESVKVLSYLMRTTRYEGAQENGLSQNQWFKVEQTPIGDLLLGCFQHSELVAINTGLLYEKIKNILNAARNN